MAVVISKQFTIPTTDILASDIEVGSSVFLNVNNVKTEFLIVHQGLPSNIYDTSCDGTWLLMKDVYVTRTYASGTYSDYSLSNIHEYLKNTFPTLLDTSVRNLIKTVKIPYSTSGYYAASTGANGLSTTAFSLGAYEVGITKSTLSSNVASDLIQDGECLSYFSGTSLTDTKRIAYMNGSAKAWCLRTPRKSSDTMAHTIDTSGMCSTVHHQSSIGIRPAFIINSSAIINPDTFEIVG